MQQTRFARFALLAAALIAFGASSVRAQGSADGFPNKPIRIVVPYATGGATDVTARIVATGLSSRLGQTVFVDNKAGAGGVIGTLEVVRAPADGYTLLLQSGAITVEPHLNKNLPYSAARDLIPLTNTVAGPMVVIVPQSSAARSVADLVATAKSLPGGLNFGSPGNGTSIHLSTELLRSMTRVPMTHVPYKGSGPAMTALIGGEIQMLIDPISTSGEMVRGGRIRALAVTTSRRSALLPDVPTVAESGVPGYESTVWYGFFLPAGTPRSVIDKLYENIRAVLNEPAVRSRFEQQGFEVVADPPTDFARYVANETARWGRIIKDANIRLE